MAKIPYFPFYPADWISSQKILLMSWEQRGIYIHLLAHCWMNPGCTLPREKEKLQRLCPGARWSNIEYVIREAFEAIGEGHSNPRLRVEHGKALAKSEKSRESIKHRWNKGKQYTDVLRTNNERNTYQNQNQNQNQNQKESKEISVRKKRETDPQIKIVIDYFYAQCQSVLGFAPAINGGQDGKRVQAALRVMPLDDVKKCVDFFLPSKKRQDLGCTLSIALSAHTINLYKQGGTNGTRYDQLKAFFGISERRGSDGLSHRGNHALGGNLSAEARSIAGAVLDGKAEEIPEVESE